MNSNTDNTAVQTEGTLKKWICIEKEVWNPNLVWKDITTVFSLLALLFLFILLSSYSFFFSLSEKKKIRTKKIDLDHLALQCEPSHGESTPPQNLCMLYSVFTIREIVGYYLFYMYSRGCTSIPLAIGSIVLPVRYRHRPIQCVLVPLLALLEVWRDFLTNEIHQMMVKLHFVYLDTARYSCIPTCIKINSAKGLILFWFIQLQRNLRIATFLLLCSSSCIINGDILCSG